MAKKRDPEKIVREIKRKTRRKFSSEEKIRIVLEGLRGEETIAELCDGASPPASLLDVGTGSGILALGAAALGCQRILGCDIDTDACRVAQENVAHNDYAEQIEITERPLEQLDGRFEVVVANILAEENVRLRDALLAEYTGGHVHIAHLSTARSLGSLLGRPLTRLPPTTMAELPPPSRLIASWAPSSAIRPPPVRSHSRQRISSSRAGRS